MTSFAYLKYSRLEDDTKPGNILMTCLAQDISKVEISLTIYSFIKAAFSHGLLKRFFSSNDLLEQCKVCLWVLTNN